MTGINFSKGYEGFALYLPSLSQQYAAFPLKDRSTLQEEGIPNGLDLSDLNFLDDQNSLWHCGQTLYSAGQFNTGRIKQPDIVSARKPETIIVGDSGGFQIGTGALPAVSGWAEYQNTPDVIVQKWMASRSIRDTILRWLDRYCDFAMTLDMPLWVLNDPKSKSSPFAKLSAQQLIDLTVENHRYFADKRGAATGARAKYLNVLQDVGNGTGEAWYTAVKDFDFEGWAFGGETQGDLKPLLTWVRRLLDDQKLDKSEWFHILMASPPKSAVYYTAIQRCLRDLLGTKIQVSYDSSTPLQSAYARHKIARVPNLTNKPRSWSIPMHDFPGSPKYMGQDNIRYLNEFPSPITDRFSINDMQAYRGDFSQSFLSQAGMHVLANHNMYVFHKTALMACDIVFNQGDTSRIPPIVIENLELIDNYLR